LDAPDVIEKVATATALINLGEGVRAAMLQVKSVATIVLKKNMSLIAIIII